MTRLARYRELLARIEPTDPKDFAGQAEIYVPPPNGLPKRLATALALQPGSSHLVVGPIGSGKTTTVRRAVEALKAEVDETGDHVSYVDVSAAHQLDRELEGVLIALAFKSLWPIARRAHFDKPIPATLRRAAETLARHANGYTEWVDPRDMEPDWDGTGPEDHDHPDIDDTVPVEHRGVLHPPRRPSTLFSELRAPLKEVTEATGANCVLFFDSLDRLENSTRFAGAVTHDLPVIAAAGIGVGIVGPYRFALSKDRSIASMFDEIHVVQSASSLTAEGRAFLAAVMRGRANSEMFPDDAIELVARFSGGILRDMLSIATRAARDAHDRGHDQITAEDVGAAALAVGGAKAVGLDASSLELLRQVADGQPFILDERRLYSVERGQVVQGDVGKWSVHPALQSFLQSPSKAA